MNLVVDIGNTQAKVSTLVNDTIMESFTFADLGTSPLPDLLARNPSIDKAIISSVSMVKEDVKTSLVHSIPYVHWMSEDTRIPIEILYKTRHTLGNDRIAAAAGANNIYPSCNVLVIDAGTAITFDFINENNQFIGGNISPGLYMRYKALHHFTKQLPLFEPGNHEMLTGDDTTNAIISGVQKGMIFEIEGYIGAYSKKHPDCKIVMTGGDSVFFDKKLKNSIFVNLHLVTLGLNRILEYNAE